jgi:hypothetical protein
MTHEMNKPTFWPRVLGVALGVFLVVSGLYERFTGQTPIWRRRPIAGWLDIAMARGWERHAIRIISWALGYYSARYQVKVSGSLLPLYQMAELANSYFSRQPGP